MTQDEIRQLYITAYRDGQTDSKFHIADPDQAYRDWLKEQDETDKSKEA